MTTLVVMVGGCGNYLGSELFHAIHVEMQRASAGGDRKTTESLTRRFFRSSGPDIGEGMLKARSLLIDMEAKAIQSCLLRQHALPDNQGSSLAHTRESISKSGTEKANCGWCWDPKFAYWQQGGCGNNWALGHEVHGPSHRDTLERLLLSLAEQADVVSAVLLLHSVAGGTGSGLGSYMTELCAELLPESCIASCCVWPFESEVSTQPFNAALALASLQRDSEGVFLFENARCARALQRHAASRFAVGAPDLAGINRCIARDLIGCCLLPSAPVDVPSNETYACNTREQQGSGGKTQVFNVAASLASYWDAGGRQHCPLRDVLTEVAAHPAFKLLTCRNLPQSLVPQSDTSRLAPYSFPSLLHRLQRMFTGADTLDLTIPPSPTSSCRHRQSRYAEAQLRRGSHYEQGAVAEDVQQNAAVAGRLCLRGPDAHGLRPDVLADCKIALWPYALAPVQVAVHPFAAFGEPHSVALTTSCRTPLPALRSTLQAGSDLLHAGAFVHHYSEFGIGTEELRLALEQVEEIVDAYAALQPA